MMHPAGTISSAETANPFLAELSWRGLLHQVTDRTSLDRYMQGGVRLAYVGYDPTADSLTIGNLVTIMLLRHWQNAGHKPVVVVGGGTGLIGDPSGKSAERDLLTPERVEANVQGQSRIFGKLLDMGHGPRGGIMVNNASWLSAVGYIEMLRDVGKHFSINQMLQRDSVKNRLESREQGISYTEFSYVLLQAYDFLHLHRTHQVGVQMGGSDQWGNIVSGIDLIRREAIAKAGGSGAENVAIDAFGVTAPLVTKSDGGKFGKSESGAIWLTAERTSPFAYYQFWLNASDADVGKFLRIFTLHTQPEIEQFERAQAAEPGQRAAQRALARGATDLLHGEAARQQAEGAASALFRGEVRLISAELLPQVFGDVPTVSMGLSVPVPILDACVQAKLCASKSEARQQVEAGAISINGEKATLQSTISTADLLHGQLAAMRRGKKNWVAIRRAD